MIINSDESIFLKENKLHSLPFLLQHSYKERGISLTVISITLDPEEEKVIKEYAKSKNISVSALFRNAVLEKIEDDIDLNLYKQAMQAYEEDPVSLSFNEMLEELSD